MPAIDATAIKELLDQVDALKQGIEAAGSEGRAKLRDIKVDDVRTEVLGPGGKLVDADWARLTGEKQTELHERLLQILDSLHAAAGLDGPTDPHHIMYGTYASNRTIVMWTATAFLVVAGLLYGVVSRWGQATGTDLAPRVDSARVAVARLDTAMGVATKAAAAESTARTRALAAVDDAGRQKAQQEVEVRARETATRRAEVAVAELTASVAALGAIRTIGLGPTESVVLLMVTLLGALGGSLHLLSSLTKYIGNRQLKRSWLLYYLSLPLAGAALAPVVYMLLRVGILAPPGATSEGSQVANLNLIGIYAFAAMTGMFAKTATDKLGEVFKTVFRTDQTTKDTIGADRPAVPRPATT